MHARFHLWIDRLRTGFWFVPSMMLLTAGGLALLLLWVDRRFDPGIRSPIAWAYSGGPQGARNLLDTIAGAMITAATVTFSLASVALSISSQQYGSRVLRNFMRDRITQTLLGAFLATYVYCILVDRSIRGAGNSGGFVPAVSVTVALSMSLGCLILLIFFVHHISASIKASHILLVIRRDLGNAIPEVFPREAGQPHIGAPTREELAGKDSCTVTSRGDGYLESVDLDGLMAVARENDFVIEALLKPGDFHIEGQPVARVIGTAHASAHISDAIAGCFIIGGERTPAQDIRYQFQQIAEVVIRSLSPAINDPFIAINGIDHISSGICQFARRPRTAGARADESGRLRVLAPVPRLPEILDITIGHIAIYAGGDPLVMAALRRALDAIAPELQGEDESRKLLDLRQKLGFLKSAR